MADGKKITSVLKRLRFPKVGKARWIALAILTGLMVLRVLDPGPLQTVRLKVFDFFQQQEPRKIMPDSPVVIVDLDEASLKEVGQWPWPRNQLAQMTLNLFKMGVRVVGFDIIFAESDRMNSASIVQNLAKLDDETKKKILKLPSNDVIFANLIKQAGRVVAGQSVLPFERKYEDRKPLRTRVFERSMRGAPKPQQWVPAVPGLLRNILPIEMAAGGHGLLALTPETDGIVRRVPAFFRYSNRLYPTISLEMMRLAVGRSGVIAKGDLSGISDITITPRRRFLVPRAILDDEKIEKLPHRRDFNRLAYAELELKNNQKRLIKQIDLSGKRHPLKKFKRGKLFDASKFLVVSTPSLKVETDRQGRIWPYFSKMDKAKYVSAKDVLSGKVDPKKIQGKLALFGTSAAGLLDIKTVPTEPNIPGVEIHAQLIESVLTNQFLTRSNFADVVEIVIALLSGLVIIVIVPWFGAKWAAIFFVFIAVGSAGASWHLFQEYKMLVDAFFGITAVLITYMILTYLGYANEEAQRRQTRDAFSKYLSPAMVEQVVENPALLSLGGVKRDMTLLFCDVRGFTSISELFDAEGLTVLINKLLTPLTDIILARNGTVDKYMGDCIMAFWNAPMDDDQHAIGGCRSALEMVAAMAPLNERLKQEAKEEGRKHLDLKVGLGLNSGEAVVGNMGTAQRMDYSVLGDTVNTAARLEGQSKTYGVDIVLGPNTHAQVSEFATLKLDNIQVKGKTVGLLVYALMGDEELAKDPEFIGVKKLVETTLAAYTEQKWEEARNFLVELRVKGERFKLDVLCDLYESRIRAYEDEPPGPDWDGIFIATTK